MDTVRRVFESDGPLLVIWLVPVVAFAVAMLVAGRGPESGRRVVLFARLLVLLYLVGIVVIVLWPLDFNYSTERVASGNWTPFGGTLGFLTSGNPRQEFLGGRDFIANIALFFPFGFLAPYAFYRWGGIVLTVVIVAILAFGGEIMQGLVIAERTFDMDDAIVGFVGGAVGAVAAAISSVLSPRTR